jgi:hypothetical protein
MSTAEDERQRNPGRGTELEGDHRVVLRAVRGRWLGLDRRFEIDSGR